jgi:hypothetical protein
MAGAGLQGLPDPRFHDVTQESVDGICDEF